MVGNQTSVGGSSNNTSTADEEEAGAGVVNQKYPLWAHATKVSADGTGAGVWPLMNDDHSGLEKETNGAVFLSHLTHYIILVFIT